MKLEALSTPNFQSIENYLNIDHTGRDSHIPCKDNEGRRPDESLQIFLFCTRWSRKCRWLTPAYLRQHWTCVVEISSKVTDQIAEPWSLAVPDNDKNYWATENTEMFHLVPESRNIDDELEAVNYPGGRYLRYQNLATSPVGIEGPRQTGAGLYL